MRHCSTGNIVIILDALDECKEKDLATLIASLKSFRKSEEVHISGSVRFLLTSRPYWSIHNKWSDIKGGISTIHLPGEEKNSEIAEDINLVVDVLVKNLSQQESLSAEISDALKVSLKAVHNRTYLWLHLTIDEVRRRTSLKRTPASFRRFLSALPRSVDEA